MLLLNSVSVKDTSVRLRSFNNFESQGYDHLVYQEPNRLFSPQVHRSLWWDLPPHGTKLGWQNAPAEVNSFEFLTLVQSVRFLSCARYVTTERVCCALASDLPRGFSSFKVNQKCWKKTYPQLLRISRYCLPTEMLSLLVTQRDPLLSMIMFEFLLIVMNNESGVDVL